MADLLTNDNISLLLLLYFSAYEFQNDGNQIDSLSSLPQASFNYINSIVGSGVIGIPYALHRAGFGLGLLLLIIVAVITDYSLILMVRFLFYIVFFCFIFSVSANGNEFKFIQRSLRTYALRTACHANKDIVFIYLLSSNSFRLPSKVVSFIFIWKCYLQP